LENQDVLDTFQNILDIVNTCENLSANFVKDGKIENAADYLMDAQILKMSHDLMGSTADKMGNSDFSEDEFISALTNAFTIDTGEHNFDRLSEIAIKCCKTSHYCVSMLGTFDLDAGPRPEKLRKERQRTKAQVGEARAPENVKQLTKSDQGAEKINIVRSEIQRVCRQRNIECLPYFELICNPHSFMKSVDVAFQISFLVRRGNI
jgi:non-structural maintenance of chromosomes element 4